MSELAKKMKMKWFDEYGYGGKWIDQDGNTLNLTFDNFRCSIMHRDVNACINYVTGLICIYVDEIRGGGHGDPREIIKCTKFFNESTLEEYKVYDRYIEITPETYKKITSK